MYISLKMVSLYNLSILRVEEWFYEDQRVSVDEVEMLVRLKPDEYIFPLCVSMLVAL